MRTIKRRVGTRFPSNKEPRVRLRPRTPKLKGPATTPASPNPQPLHPDAFPKEHGWGRLLHNLDLKHMAALMNTQLGEYEVSRLNRRLELQAARAVMAATAEEKTAS